MLGAQKFKGCVAPTGLKTIGGNFICDAFPGLTPWAKLFCPYGAGARTWSVRASRVRILAAWRSASANCAAATIPRCPVRTIEGCNSRSAQQALSYSAVTTSSGIIRSDRLMKARDSEGVRHASGRSKMGRRHGKRLHVGVPS